MIVDSIYAVYFIIWRKKIFFFRGGEMIVGKEGGGGMERGMILIYIIREKNYIYDT
jgi:hypothetical protein